VEELEILFKPWWVSIRMCCCRLLYHEVHHYSLSLSLFDSCLFYEVPIGWVSVLSPCLHWCWFYFRLGLRACSVFEILKKKWTKNKINYRSRRCIQTNCRSVCYRHLNISSDSTYTPTHLLIVPYKYQFLYNDNIKVILYIELKTVVVYAINVLSYKTKNKWSMNFIIKP
jgi:hypothetical protein